MTGSSFRTSGTQGNYFQSGGNSQPDSRKDSPLFTLPASPFNHTMDFVELEWDDKQQNKIK